MLTFWFGFGGEEEEEQQKKKFEILKNVDSGESGI